MPLRPTLSILIFVLTAALLCGCDPDPSKDDSDVSDVLPDTDIPGDTSDGDSSMDMDTEETTPDINDTGDSEDSELPPTFMECAPDEEKCGEECVDLSRNPDHCGACDSACDAGMACNNGLCEESCAAPSFNAVGDLIPNWTGTTTGEDPPVFGDFDNDGQEDVAVFDPEIDKVYVYFNDSGVLSAPVVLTADERTGSAIVLSSLPRIMHPLHAADINDDGNLDLLAANFAPGSVSVFMGEMGRSFAPAEHTLVGGHPLCLETANLDADADLELVVCNASGNSLRIIQLTADGTIDINNVDNQSYFGNDGEALLDIVDLNDDNDLDILVYHPSNREMDLLWGPFDAGANPPIEGDILDGRNGRIIAVGEIDGDTTPEIVVSTSQDGLTIEHWNPNTSTLDIRSTLSAIDNDTSDPDDIELVDLDDDGDIDLLGVNDEGMLLWWLNQGGNTFPDPPGAAWTGAGTAVPGALTAGGIPTIILTRSTDARRIPADALDTLPSLLGPLEGYFLTSVDLTGDGISEVVTFAQGGPESVTARLHLVRRGDLPGGRLLGGPLHRQPQLRAVLLDRW